MKNTLRPRVLVVEDEFITALHIVRRLDVLGFSVACQAANGEDALALAVEHSVDLVLMDIFLQGDMDGIQTVERLRNCIDVPVVYLTANTDPATLERAKLTNPSGFLVKPFDDLELKNTLEIAVHRHRAEATQRLYHRAFIASVSAIFIVDVRLPNKPITQVNPAFEKMTGYAASEVVGRDGWFLEGAETDPSVSARFRKAFDEQLDCRLTILLYRKDGSNFWSELTLSPVPDASGRVTHFIGVQHDITALRCLETQLRHAQKLESIGQLAAGIAHEINTPTQYIGDNTCFVRDAFADLTLYFETQARLLLAAKASNIDPEIIQAAENAAQVADIDYLKTEIPKAIEQSLEGVRRVSSIVSAMKEFSHPGAVEKVNIDLNQSIASTLTVCRNEWKYTAEVVTDFDPQLPLIFCHPGEINQTILNLVVNASHAIADALEGGSGSNKGTITIITRQEGQFVKICVRDTGTGIPERIRHRIFDPFFTTKKVGKGTGQGLAIAWGVIVEKHGGTIQVESEIGKGTTFILRLPIWPSSSSAPTSA